MKLNIILSVFSTLSLLSLATCSASNNDNISPSSYQAPTTFEDPMVTLRKESEVKAKQAADADRAAIAARTLRPYSTKSAEVAIRDVLRDSDSARFTDVTRNPKTGAVCGKLNAKNAYGGYVGAAPFIYFYDPDEKTGQILMDPKIADTHTIPYIEAFCSPE